MTKRLFLLAFITIAALFSGCVMPLSPITNETRVVTPLSNQTYSVFFKEPMVWLDQQFGPTKGIRFPEGTYMLEAEDSEYRYFKAPGQIEYRILQNGKVTDDRFMAGGLFLGKTTFKIVPAGAYLPVGGNTNMLTWKLGSSFLGTEGTKWTKNF